MIRFLVYVVRRSVEIETDADGIGQAKKEAGSPDFVAPEKRLAATFLPGLIADFSSALHTIASPAKSGSILLRTWFMPHHRSHRRVRKQTFRNWCQGRLKF